MKVSRRGRGLKTGKFLSRPGENWQEITINYIPAVLIVSGPRPENLSSLIRIFAVLEQKVMTRGVNTFNRLTTRKRTDLLPRKGLYCAFVLLCFWDHWSWSLRSSQLSIHCIMVAGGQGCRKTLTSRGKMRGDSQKLQSSRGLSTRKHNIPCKVIKRLIKTLLWCVRRLLDYQRIGSTVRLMT